MENVHAVEEPEGANLERAANYILNHPNIRSWVFNSKYFSVQKRDSGEVDIQYHSQGIHNVGAVHGSTGDSFTGAMEHTIMSLKTQDPASLMEIAERLDQSDTHNGSMCDDLEISNINDFKNRVDEEEEQIVSETHGIEVLHDADDFEEDIDIETQLFQLVQESEENQDVATVLNYVHNESNGTIRVLVELPDQSQGRAIYDVPESVDDPLTKLLNVAVVEGSQESVSLKNIELLVGSLIPVYSDDGDWFVDIRGRVDTNNDEMVEGDGIDDGEIDYTMASVAVDIEAGDVFAMLVIGFTVLLSVLIYTSL